MKTSTNSLRILCAMLLLGSGLAALGQRTGENGGVDASQKAGAPAPSERLNFHTDLFTGRFGYQIPLSLAPGRHGSTPTVALSYNSSSDDGWCGVGWNLDFGYIQRITKRGVPVSWTNGSPQKAYDDSKGFTFSLNGQAADLVSIGNNEYRAEIEGGFLRFSLLTSSNQWLVVDKSGNKYYFGQTSASRMINSKSGWSSTAPSGTFRWALSHVETVLGDTVDYTYTNVGATLYPLRISYNGFTNGLPNTHTVDFILGTRTNDVRVSYISGYRVEQNQRLAAIVHKVGSMVVWSNQLSYVTSPSTQRSLLSSSTLWGTNLTVSWPAISFNYSTQSFGFQSVTYWTNLSIPSGGYPDYYRLGTNFSGRLMLDLLDMDGDGLPDRVYQPVYSPWTNLWVQRNNGAGFDNPVPFGPLSSESYFDGVQTFNTYNNVDFTAINSTYMRFLDINNDGLPDRVMDPVVSLSVNNGSPYDHLVVQLNVSSNLDGTANWTNVVSSLYKDQVGSISYRAIENGTTILMLDMNGDGLPDRVMAKPDVPYDSYLVQFNTGSGFSGTNAFGFQVYDNPNQPGTYGGTLSAYFLRLIDLNGDGLPDRVFYPTNSTGTPEYNCDSLTNVLVQFNNGYGFEPTAPLSSGWSAMITATAWPAATPPITFGSAAMTAWTQPMATKPGPILTD